MGVAQGEAEAETILLDVGLLRMVSGLQLATCQHDAKAKGQQVGAATNSEMKFSPFFSNQKWMICRAAKAYPKTTPAKAAPPILSRRSILSQQSQQSAPKTASSASNDKEVWVFVCGFDLKWSFVYVTSFFWIWQLRNMLNSAGNLLRRSSLGMIAEQCAPALPVISLRLEKFVWMFIPCESQGENFCRCQALSLLLHCTSTIIS